MTTKNKLISILAVSAALFAGCDKSAGDELAKVGDRQITSDEFGSYLKVKRIRVRDQAHADRLLRDYAQREALADAIEEQGLLDAGQTQAELNEFRKELLISRYFDEYLSQQAGPDAVANYYNAHPDEFADKKAHVAHVLVRTNRRMSEEERKAKRTKIQEAYSKIRAGEDFGAIAQQYSEDRNSSQKGGDLGWIKEGSIDPAFSKVAFELDAGSVSEPFETPFGFHVVKVVEEPKVIRKPLSAVEGDIRYQLRAKAKKAEVERLEGLVTVEVEDGAYVPAVPLEKSAANGAETKQEAE